MTSQQHDVVVVGGGIAGLTAAWHLRDRDVVLLESEDQVGGRIRSARRDPYWMVVGAHFLSHPDSPLGLLATEMRVEPLPVKGKMTALWMNGRLIDKGRIETYPFRLPLSLGARLSLIRTGLRLQRAHRRALRSMDDPIHGDEGFNGEHVVAKGGSELDDQSFADLLGGMHPDVADIMLTASNRVTAEPEEMSAHFGAALVANVWVDESAPRQTIRGGLGELAGALSARLDNRVLVNTKVSEVVPGNEGVKVRARRGSEPIEMSARYAIVPTPAPITRRMITDLPADKTAGLEAVKYGPFVALAVRTAETGPMPYDNLYALGVVNRTNCMLFNTMIPLRQDSGPRPPGGSLTLHAGAGQAARLMDCTDEEIEALFLADLYEIFPSTRGLVTETWVQRWALGYPFWPPGHLRHQEALARPHRNVYFAGDYVGYPSTGPSARAALLAARVIRKKLTSRVH